MRRKSALFLCIEDRVTLLDPSRSSILLDPPRARLPRFAALAGDRYDYEARMLVAAAKLPQPPVQVPITTVYENGNGTSHYRPLADTFST